MGEPTREFRKDQRVRTPDGPGAVKAISKWPGGSHEDDRIVVLLDTGRPHTYRRDELTPAPEEKP